MQFKYVFDSPVFPALPNHATRSFVIQTEPKFKRYETFYAPDCHLLRLNFAIL